VTLPTGPRRATPPPKRRLSSLELAVFLGDFDASTQGLIRAVRRMILAAAPHATEAIRFNTLCYFDPSVTWGAIGGNICLIEVKCARVWLSFILGSTLPDPSRGLTGKAKSKRFLLIDSLRTAARPSTRALIRASAAQARSRREP
jgi:hypothetical protein